MKKYISIEEIEEEGFVRAKKDSWVGYEDYYLVSINPQYPYYLYATLHYPKKAWRESDNLEHQTLKIILHRYYRAENPTVDRDLNEGESEQVFKGALKDVQELNTLLQQLGIV